MLTSLVVPTAKHEDISRAYLDDLLWGTLVNGPAILNFNSYFIDYPDLDDLEPFTIPVLALCTGGLDPFKFRDWCSENYIENASDKQINNYEERQKQIYYKTQKCFHRMLSSKLFLDLSSIQKRWEDGVFQFEGA